MDEHLLIEHFKGASWAYLTDEAEKDYVFETMATCGPTTVSRDVHGKRPLTWRLKTAALETTLIATTSICVKWLASETIVMNSKQRPRHRLKRRLAN
ncbi:hypothetical protein Bpfe_029432 [Biomphalaria pfeifferi]|uniref:Uncharacterized protein n=1 Tax=Biomphalaria pfeifferi TaxID=112525 RepID=A0AAD8AUE4_BIOPF|nr:hypothetical protein Bpfe_029432 [Biomphalaria pfeifferi]